MKIFLFVILGICSLPTLAQKQEIIDKLEEYHFSESFLTENLKDADAEWHFDTKITTTTSTETKVEEANFDPTKEIGDRWTLVRVNGSTPTSKDIKQFNKAHNTTRPDINGEIDDNSWKIIKDDDQYLEIEFKYDKTSLPKKYSFFADCIGTAYFNKENKQLEKAVFKNIQPLKIKIFKVSKLDMEVDYQYNEAEDVYLVKSENLSMETKLLGQQVIIEETTEFFNYKKK